MTKYPMTKEIRTSNTEYRTCPSTLRASGFGIPSSLGISSFVIFWIVAGSLAFADAPKLIGESPRTVQRFAEAAGLEKQQHWAEAVEVYLRLAEESGDDLVPDDGEAGHLLPARRMVSRRIAARSELLAPYRARVEPRAKRLLDQGRDGRDRQLLQQVVDQYFCSRSADAALHLLGDLACERGEFEEARHFWHQLEPAASPGELAYPDPQGGPASARAKVILTRLLAGERSLAAIELTAFRKSHPEAVGHLAGRDGNYLTILQSLFDNGDNLRVPSVIGVAPGATTLGGDATRNGVLTGVLPPFSPEPRYPPIALPPRPASQGHARPVTLPCYPLIHRGQVFLAVARHVMAYELATGQLSGRYELLAPLDVPAEAAAAKVPPSYGPFTLTADGDHIYARFGPCAGRPVRGATMLVCLQWHPEKATPDERLRSVWTLSPPSEANAGEAAWEGTPIVRDNRLFVGMTRFDAGRAITGIACYPAADPTAGPFWVKDVFEATADQAERVPPRLVTLAGSIAAFCSDGGVIIGLDTATGRRAWAFRYPPAAPQNRPTALRSPAACIFAAGRLYAAPADSDHVFCLDAASGRLLWSSNPMTVGHLLGVTNERVVCELGGFQAGLAALDANTGRLLPDWGYRVAGADAFAPFGRGLLFGDRVYWPTRSGGVHELRWDGTTGYIPTALRALNGGNLAYGDGCLAVATADELRVLVVEPKDGMATGHGLGRLPAERQHDLLLWRAEMLHRSGRPTEARAAFEQAAGPEFAVARRCLASLRWSEFERETGHEDTAAAIRRAVIANNELSDVTVREADGRLWSTRKWLNDGSVGRSQSTSGDPRAPAVAVHLPLESTWRLSLEGGREWALVTDHGSGSGRVFVAGRDWLACRSIADAKELWRRDLAFAPNWCEWTNGSLIVAGDNGIARLSADGDVAWQFRLPESAPWFDRPGWRDRDAAATADRLTGFHWAGGRLFARLGPRLLVAFDVETGSLIWQRSALIGGDICPEYFADNHCVVAQSADGRRWVFDASSGTVIRSAAAPRVPWPNAPILLDPQRLLLVEDDRLVALDRSTWETAWAWNLRRSVSLSGELPHTRLIRGNLLVMVPRNDCYEIERMDPIDGRPFGDPLVIGTKPADLATAAIHEETLSIICDAELKSFDLQTNKLLSQRKLPSAAKWRVEPTADGLILWTLPAALPAEAPASGHVVVMPWSEFERQRMAFQLPSLALGLGPGNALRSVHIVGDEVVIVSESEVRGYRGAKREVK
jgi:outer membrane protein assembly factor BamB